MFKKFIKSFERVKQLSEEKKGKIIIFGSGECGKELFNDFKALGIDVDFFIDNNESLKDAEYKGVPISDINLLKELSIDDFFVCVAVKVKDVYMEIRHQLETLGLEECKQFGDFGYDCDAHFGQKEVN